MTGFTVGFIFSHGWEYVLLLKKDKPDTHRGLLNGIGGKKHSDETWLRCIARECQEETGLEIPTNKWHQLERTVSTCGQDLFIYMTKWNGCLLDVQTGDTGLAHWYATEQLPTTCISDIPRLVAQALREQQKLNGAS